MIIAGLGNPGPEYENTRHNVGFWALEALAKRFKTQFDLSPFKAKAASFTFKGGSHFLLKPMTYMNLSGEAVARFLTHEQMLIGDLIVIADDITIPVGKLRLRPSGSEGGHNGLRSIIGYIGKNFWRLRIGVGRPESGEAGCDLISHVLGPMPALERGILDSALKDLPDLVTMLLLGMGPRAMSRFNGRDYSQPEPEFPPTPKPVQPRSR